MKRSGNSKKVKSKTIVTACGISLALVLVFLSSALQPARVLIASWRLEKKIRSLDMSSTSTRELKSQIQKHFLDYGTYIPSADIILAGSNERLTFLMHKACGKDSIYIWVPLKWSVPFKGVLVREWCLKPKLKTPSTETRF